MDISFSRLCWLHLISLTSKLWNFQDSVLRHFVFSTSVAYLVISSSFMVLNSTNMPVTPKFMSIAQVSSLNSSLITLIDDFTPPYRNKYVRYNMSKIKFLIFFVKVVFFIPVIGNSVFLATRARNSKLILDSYLLTPSIQLLSTFY